ncbi:MAG TPA: hypothetical protein VLH09_00855 [Bryobacteraceae bacterium]|nr:hypothetical protein [Bryobacteraceae bacterium]
MELQKDFEELCASLNGRDVSYLIVGGYALAFHGAPRFTGDVEIFVQPTLENIARLLAALGDFGFGGSLAKPEDLLSENKILELGRPPVQVHIMASITGVSWDEAWKSCKAGTYGGAPVKFIGRDAFIANKRATGRAKDLADIESLGETK